ncbi:MAG: PDZ domain-containing protein [candidate division Zixibacteria bacterium]|nr:PDZ domain-containing protein [candidate division Zixibacteria bacterium]
MVRPRQLKRTSPLNDVMRMLMVILLCCIASVSCVADPGEPAETSPPPGAYKIVAKDGKIEIPFEIFRGDIRFECKVNGRQVHMLLDDGYMWDQLLFWGSPEVDSLGLAYDGEVGVGAENSEKLASKTASGITVAFPDVEFTEQTAVVMPYSSGTSSMWRGSVGQISATFFRHFVVDINFDRMIIALIEPDKFEDDGRGTAVPWQPLGFGPWSIPATLQMEDGRSVSMRLLIDLGYNDQLQLVIGGKHSITRPEKNLPASLGFNIQRVETRGFIGRLPGVDIGGYKIPDVIAGFVSEECRDHAVYEAMVGLKLLSRFNLVFDYHRQRLYAEPNNSFGTPFEYDMSGFVVGPAVGGYSIIKEVHQDSPAEEAGLQKGDKILMINDRPVTDYDFFELDAMSQQQGAQINLLIEREGKREKVSLTLRRII